MLTGIPSCGTSPVFAAGRPAIPFIGGPSQRVDFDASAFHQLINRDHETHFSPALSRHDVPIIDPVIHGAHWVVDWFQQDPMRVVVGIGIGMGIGMGAIFLFSTVKILWFRHRLRHQLDLFNADVTQREVAEALLVQSYLKFSGADEILLLAEQYAGPRNEFLSLIRERCDFLDLARRRESARDAISRLLPFGSLRNRWHIFRAEGWKVRFAKTTSVSRKERTIFLNATVTARDPRLTFYADVTALTLWRRIGRRKADLYKTIEQRVIASKILMPLSNKQISRLIDYLVVRDVYCLTLDYYRSLREEDPRVRIRRFEEILLLGRIGLAAPVAEFKKSHADVDRRLLDLVDDISLEELLDEVENH